MDRLPAFGTYPQQKEWRHKMKKRYLSFIGAMLCIASLSGCSLSGNEASQAAVLQEQPETVRMAGMEEVQRETLL